METIHGFQLKAQKEIRELKTKAEIFLHMKSGAQLLSLNNEDENKVFGITFRTPPSDSTGVAHILEHSVLCGSRKYPVKEPFVELLKGSLQTFLNAMTYPDRTTYPVASQNLQDFYNLIDVYLDAVFYPRLTPFIFQQEGWHLELDDSGQALRYQGVVYSEMKGAYSSPDNLISEYSIESLFPESPYGYDAGGNPKHIPELTYEGFQAFHKRYYHPSNARIYFYGDDDPQERLRLLDQYLRDFEPLEIESEVPLQTPFRHPKRIVKPYAAKDDEQEQSRGLITVNWLLSQSSDVEMNFLLRILEYIFLGMPGSPLRKALIDSGLGEDLVGEGLGPELRQMYFSTGLRGIQIEKSAKLEDLVAKTFTSLTRKGIDPQTTEAALNTIEFRFRENNTGGLPRGLILMLRSLSTWLYGADPLGLIAFEEPIERIKTRVKKENRLFEDLIDRVFLKNSHRTTLILQPDPGLRRREEEEEKRRLQALRSSLSSQQLQEILDNARMLKQMQQTPDPPEALATIPVLKLSDLDKENKTIPLESDEHNGTRLLFHDLFTNSIVYLDVGFNLHTLPPAYLPYVPLFGRALVEMGTRKEDFVALNQRIGRKTGGISPQVLTSATRNSEKGAAWLFLRAKSTTAQSQEMIGILLDLLSEVHLDNPERFRQMVMEEKARWEQRLIPTGHRVVNLRLRSHFDEAHWAAEQMEGVSYFFFLKGLARALDEDWSSVLRILEEMRRLLIDRKAMILNVTLDEVNRATFETHVHALLNGLSECSDEEAPWSPTHPAPFEGLAIPSQVNYVGKGTNLFESGYRFHGSSLVITRFLRTSWLWEQVRVQGGAYGAFCLLDRHCGAITFVSYRDPNLKKTLDAFEKAATILQESDLDRTELTKAIIGAVGDLDGHLLPDAKGFTSMVRYLCGDTEEARQQMREEVLNTQVTDFKRFGEVLGEAMKNGIVKVLGPPEAMKKAKREGFKEMEVFSVL